MDLPPPRFNLYVFGLNKFMRQVSFPLSEFSHNRASCLLHTGVFTVSGILDSFIYHGQKAIKKKMEIGKFS